MQGGVRIVKIVAHVPPLSLISFSCAGASVLVVSLDSYLYNWGPRSVPPSFSGSWTTTEIRKLADVPVLLAGASVGSPGTLGALVLPSVVRR